jgi:hypothetical protein
MLDTLHSSISLLAIVVPRIDTALAEAAIPSTEGIRTALCIGLTTLFSVAGILLTERIEAEPS